MGQVFTFQEIERRRIPQIESFARTVERTKEIFADEDSIVGSIVCGSVTRDDFNFRSDVDCFVLYDHTQESEAFAVMQAVTASAAFDHVPLSCIPCDTLLSRTHLHHVGGSFYWHLKRAVETGGIVKGDPLPQVKDIRSWEEEAESYLRAKMYNLQGVWSRARIFSEEQKILFLKKLLEAPVHIARKVLAHQGLLSGDSKSQIRARYRESVSPALSNQLERLIELDYQYSTELREQLDYPNQKKYQQMLDSILLRSGDVLAFIRSNAMHLVATAR